MKIKDIPKPGLRNIKTAIAVLLCVFLFELIGRPNPLIACSTTIICMKDTVFNSYKSGVDRLVGTLIGGVVGFVFLLIRQHFALLPTEALLVGIGIVLVIYLCTLLKKSDSTAVIACIVFLAIVIGVSDMPAYLYAINRMVDTFVGIVVALLVNINIYPMEETEGTNN